MLEEYITAVREKSPLIHNITNYVTVNDCANILLACGGSPIMADDEGEVEEITALCGGLTINIGTLNKRTIEAMVKAGQKANELEHPVVLDPVGAGASALRTQTALRLLDEIRFTVIRGNLSECKALLGDEGESRGVDAAETAGEVEAIALAKRLSRKTGAVVAITGATDVVTDGERTYLIRNGCPEMGKITGTGCMLSAVCAAFVTTSPDKPLEAAAAAVAAMGLCGERAKEKAAGTGSLRMHLIDEMSNLTAKSVKDGMKIELA